MPEPIRELHRRSAVLHSRILLVEDDPSIVSMLEWILQRQGFTQVLSTPDPTKVARIADAYRPDLVILDLHFPTRSGFEVIAELREAAPEESFLPILVLTGDMTSEAKERALSSGAHDFLHKPFDRVEALLRIENLLETRSLYRRLEERTRALERTVAERTRELEVAQVEILERLTQAVEMHDDATGQHTRRVGETSARVAVRLGFPLAEVEVLRRAAPLHDVGKVGIPDTLLLKPGPLTPAEFEVVKTHTTIGARMLSGGSSGLIRMAEQIALSHHERWDGAGYPRGLRGSEIPVEARIVALADFCDALAHDRPYRAAWPRERIEAEIRHQRGRHFDPHVVDAYFSADAS